MEEVKIIPYEEGMKLEEHKKYIVPCGIEFIYSPIDDEKKKEKPYLLNNGMRINHIPTSKDSGLLNLKNMGDRPKEEQKAIMSKGGINSAKVQAKRRSFRESLELFMSLSISKEQLSRIDSSILEMLPSDLKLTQGDLIALKNIEIAQDGSEKHSVWVRDTIGEKPTDRHEIEAEVITEGDRALIEKISRRLQEEV